MNPSHRRTDRRRLPAAGTLLLLGVLGACAPRAAHAPAERSSGTLRISSSPSGARIILDGAATAFRTPTLVPGAAAGRHRLMLSLAGHRNWEGDVDLPAGTTIAVHAELEALATGSLGVRSVPSGASVFVDGRSANLETPVEVDPLAVGTHTVQLRRDGYEPWSQAVVIIPDRHLSIQAALTPARGSLGHLEVQSRPPRARISLDGFPTGKVTPDTLYALQPGAHRVDLAVEGYRPWSGSVTVREGRTAHLLVTLQQLPE